MWRRGKWAPSVRDDPRNVKTPECTKPPNYNNAVGLCWVQRLTDTQVAGRLICVMNWCGSAQCTSWPRNGCSSCVAMPTGLSLRRRLLSLVDVTDRQTDRHTRSSHSSALCPVCMPNSVCSLMLYVIVDIQCIVPTSCNIYRTFVSYTRMYKGQYAITVSLVGWVLTGSISFELAAFIYQPTQFVLKEVFTEATCMFVSRRTSIRAWRSEPTPSRRSLIRCCWTSSMEVSQPSCESRTLHSDNFNEHSKRIYLVT